jgi:hypothetical protein
VPVIDGRHVRERGFRGRRTWWSRWWWCGWCWCGRERAGDNCRRHVRVNAPGARVRWEWVNTRSAMVLPYRSRGCRAFHAGGSRQGKHLLSSLHETMALDRFAHSLVMHAWCPTARVDTRLQPPVRVEPSAVRGFRTRGFKLAYVARWPAHVRLHAAASATHLRVDMPCVEGQVYGECVACRHAPAASTVSPSCSADPSHCRRVACGHVC